MRLVDTHAHLMDPQLAPLVDEVLERARASGVLAAIAIGTDVDSSRQALALAQRHPMVYASIGIHPNECHLATSEDWQVIETLASQDRVVALGETGLDKHWNFAPFDRQLEWFNRHLQLSAATRLPLVIHMRDCEAEMLQVLSEASAVQTVRGVMHSFTGSTAGAERFLKFGLFISFAGMVTYPKSSALRETAKLISPDRLLIETDSPYLSPHPCRGQRPNEPALMVHTCQSLAETRGVAPEALAELTTENACRLFGFELGQ
ncbi:MAG TPA: TatD family hydrolase [Pirellulaceae bacterium]|nr:TatD family hydrolase [Pirellulaceae bacterium]